MRDYFQTKRISIPIPTEPELYLIAAGIIAFCMWIGMVYDGQNNRSRMGYILHLWSRIHYNVDGYSWLFMSMAHFCKKCKRRTVPKWSGLCKRCIREGYHKDVGQETL